MKVCDWSGIELVTPGSVVRHVTDCAMRPSRIFVGTTIHCNILNIEAGGLMVSKRIFCNFFPLRSIWKLALERGLFVPHEYD